MTASTEKHPWVLIVDDDADVQELLSELLAGEGYHVAVASNGLEAIDILEAATHQPCAVIVDLLMPGVVGQELIEYVRGDTRLSQIPLAIVSGSPQLAPPGLPVFKKPVPARTLLDFVHNQCGI